MILIGAKPSLATRNEPLLDTIRSAGTPAGLLAKPRSCYTNLLDPSCEEAPHGRSGLFAGSGGAIAGARPEGQESQGATGTSRPRCGVRGGRGRHRRSRPEWVIVRG